MSFLSLTFLLFLVAVAGVYFCTPQKYQWIVLLISSYIFYFFAGWKLIFYLLFTTLSTYFSGLRIGKLNEQYERSLVADGVKIDRQKKKELKQYYNKKKKVWMVLALVANFGILFVLKYFPFISAPINFMLNIFGNEYRIPDIKWMLPLGISFYTFQSMGYIIDLYRDKYQPEKNVARFALFVSFFPQLIQGPISRFDELANQLYEGHPFDYTRVKHGIELMLWGYIKKMVISDRLAIITATIYGDPEKYAGLYLLTAGMLGWVELFTDFSGGIDVARGVSEVFGITMPINFKQPFFADSLSEFWRRWHITLNNWWRDYIFYPLSLSKAFTNMGRRCRKIFGDNAGKKMPMMLAMIIVRVINSMWHGASLKYFLGGFYHGILIAMAYLLEPQLKALTKWLKIKTDCLSWKLFQIVRTFFLVSLTRFMNTTNSWSEIVFYFKCLVAKFNPWIFFDESFYNLGVGREQLQMVFLFIAVGVVVSIFQEKGYNIREELDKQNLIFRWGVYLAGILSIILFGTYGLGFDAASFAYMQF